MCSAATLMAYKKEFYIAHEIEWWMFIDASKLNIRAIFLSDWNKLPFIHEIQSFDGHVTGPELGSFARRQVPARTVRRRLHLQGLYSETMTAATLDTALQTGASSVV
ncbi:hypothetical protein TNCV_4138171 [Trichonephila clavipes]|nr:hypothetical protein TNCV_4138171 [Trichonephila clavipes]